MRSKLPVIFAVLSLSLLGGCHRMRSEPPSDARAGAAPLGADELRVRGTVKKSEVGAGCWQFLADSGGPKDFSNASRTAPNCSEAQVTTWWLPSNSQLSAPASKA